MAEIAEIVGVARSTLYRALAPAGSSQGSRDGYSEGS
jgi:DNA-binding phage protein